MIGRDALHSASAPNRLRVVAYNVRSLRDDGAAVARVLRSLDPDVVCIQEAPKYLWWRGRCAALARQAGLVYVGGGRPTGGTALFASIRVDVSHVQEHRLPSTRGLVRRGVVIATLAKNGVPFAAASIHLGLDAAQRERHLADVLDLVDGLVDRLDHGPIVIAGDINESSEGPAWAALASVYTDVGAGDNTATFSVRNPRHRIDGIFVRGLTVESYHVVNSPDVQKASDHRPIMAELGLVAG